MVEMFETIKPAPASIAWVIDIAALCLLVACCFAPRWIGRLLPKNKPPHIKINARKLDLQGDLISGQTKNGLAPQDRQSEKAIETVLE